MTDFDALKERALKDPEIKAEYDRLGPIYQFVGASKDDLRRCDGADHLKTEEEMAAFLEAVMVEAGDDLAFKSWAFDVVARAFKRLGPQPGRPENWDGLIDLIKAGGVPADFLSPIERVQGNIPKPVLREPTVQINAKVPADFRERFMTALAEETAGNRAVRSIGDFLMVIFEEWKNRQGDMPNPP
jgi:hypothetical protein